MVYTAGMSINRSTCDFPGPILLAGPNKLIHYLPHPSGQCTITTHLPSAVVNGAPWLMLWKGGLGYNPGERGSFDAGAMGAETLAQTFLALGYVVFMVNYPSVSSNRDDGQSYNEVLPLALWPEQVFYCASAIQFVRDNYIGSSLTRKGTALLGAGNSIDPLYGCVWGNSWGCTLAMMCGLTPDSMIPQFASPFLSQEPNRFTSSHRLRCWAGQAGQVDLTQFDIEPLTLTQKPTYPLGEIYMADRAQWVNRVESSKKWSTTRLALKQLSPWHMLQRQYAENTQTTFFMQWRANNVNPVPEEANLSYLNFVPNKVPTAADRTAGIAWRDPHHNFQAKPWRDALLSYGSDAAAPIRSSVIRWGTTTTNPGAIQLSDTAYATSLHNHLVNVCLFPK